MSRSTRYKQLKKARDFLPFEYYDDYYFVLSDYNFDFNDYCVKIRPTDIELDDTVYIF